MAERGAVHTFKPWITEPDRANPGKRRKYQSKLWYWRFSYRGKRYVGGPGEKKRERAREHGDKRRSEVRAGMEEDPRRLTFAALEAILRAECAVRPAATRLSMETALSRLKHFFAPGDLVCEMRRSRVLEYQAFQVRAGYQASTVNLDTGYLHQALTLAHEEGRILAVPPFPPRLKRRPREQVLLPFELDRILVHFPAYYRLYFLVADEMGWRARSELRTRQWPDIDFNGGWVRLDAASTKSRRPRVFPMTERLRSLLLEQRAFVEATERAVGRVIPFVFCSDLGRQLGRSYRKLWAKACRKAGFGKLEGRTGPWSSARVPHDLRRAALQRWELLLIPRNASMAAAGHSEERTFSGYAQAGPEAMKAMAQRIDDARREEAPPKVVSIDKR
jgi:integrase